MKPLAAYILFVMVFVTAIFFLIKSKDTISRIMLGGACVGYTIFSYIGLNVYPNEPTSLQLHMMITFFVLASLLTSIWLFKWTGQQDDSEIK